MIVHSPARFTLHYAPDNASLIVRLVLEELGCAYQTMLVDRSSNEQHMPHYLELNPNGQIPVLETPAGPLFETAAILLWLADSHAALAPAQDSPYRGTFLTWLFWVSNTLHNDIRILFYPQRYSGMAPSDLNAKLRERITAHLTCIEAALIKSPFLTLSNDGQPTVLAFYLPCLLRWLCLYPIDSNKNWFKRGTYPALNQLCHDIEQRSCLKAVQDAEGLGPTPFTTPSLPNPPEGSPL